VLLSGVLVFGLALALRTAGSDSVTSGGLIGPLDDLYHAYRIVLGAAPGGHVLRFDPRRALGGSECPWPPLYDGAVGTAARVLAGGEEGRLLPTVAWFPPVVESAFAALIAVLLARARGPLAGSLAGLALAIAPASIDVSRFGSIDHHFLEPPLIVLLVAATGLLLNARAPRALGGAVLLLAASLVVSLMIQMALLLAAAAATLAILAWGEREANAAASAAFSIAAAAILLYATSQSDGYPVDEWHLGIPHLAALVGAATACAAAALLRSRAVSRIPTVVIAAVCGALAACAIPGAAPALLSGSRFFGGDPWLSTIVEFQPLFFAGWASAPSTAARLGIPAILLILYALRPSAGAGPLHPRSNGDRILFLFLGVYVAAALSSQRFLVCAVTLVAVAGALVAAEWFASRGRVSGAVAAALLLVPWLSLLPEALGPAPNFPPGAQPFRRAAESLRDRGPGRVLSPWSWGHVFHVFGGKPVLVDGFGASIGRGQFENALGAVLVTREEHLAEFCRSTGTRWIVLDNPLTHLTVQAQAMGLSPGFFVRGGKPARILPRMRFSFWWRAYFDRGRPVEEPKRSAPAFREFRLVYADPELSPGPARFRGPAAQVWEWTGFSTDRSAPELTRGD
jgi:asparagine N-glycosylation enzyme membrane subunit Stt3